VPLSKWPTGPGRVKTIGLAEECFSRLCRLKLVQTKRIFFLTREFQLTEPGKTSVNYFYRNFIVFLFFIFYVPDFEKLLFL